MHYKTIIHEKKGRICYITLNRPLVGNAIDIQMTREITDVCRIINQDEEIMVVVLKGAGDTFSTGSDPQEREAIYDASESIARIERVTIAAIDGPALGEGLELSLACDMRIVSDRSRFCLPQTAYGMIPGGGGTQRLPRLIGRGKALEMLFTAEPIDAQEAFRIGLASKVVTPDDLIPATEQFAERIINCGPIALRYAKEAVNKGLDLTLEQGLRMEADLYFLIQTTTDRMEGIRAFREKRPPRFSGE